MSFTIQPSSTPAELPKLDLLGRSHGWRRVVYWLSHLEVTMKNLSNTTRRSALAAMAGAAVAVRPGRAAKKATAFALIGDRYHNSDYIRIGLTRTIARQLEVSVDFTDETSLLNAETLDGYKLLIVLRDGMIWPNGYGGDESSNAAWNGSKPKLIFDPPLPQMRARPEFWIQPAQGKAVRDFV